MNQGVTKKQEIILDTAGRIKVFHDIYFELAQNVGGGGGDLTGERLGAYCGITEAFAVVIQEEGRYISALSESSN